MNVEGRICAILPIATGEGKNGVWRSRDAVLETDGQYPKKVVFNLFGDKIDQYLLSIGDMVNVHFDIDSREYNGRWYPSIKAYRVDVKGGAAVAATSPAVDPFAVPIDNAPVVGGGDAGADLPF